MDLAEDPADQLLRGVGVRQHRPIGTGDLGALQGALPERADLVGIPRLAQPIDGRAMSAIEGLLQQLGCVPLLPGEQHGAAVQLMIGLLLSTGVDLEEDLTKLCRRQTRANDRAVERGAHLPDAPAPRQRPDDQGRLVLKQAQRTRNRRAPQCREARVQAWQLCCHASIYPYEHSDVQRQKLTSRLTRRPFPPGSSPTDRRLSAAGERRPVSRAGRHADQVSAASVSASASAGITGPPRLRRSTATLLTRANTATPGARLSRSTE